MAGASDQLFFVARSFSDGGKVGRLSRSGEQLVHRGPSHAEHIRISGHGPGVDVIVVGQVPVVPGAIIRCRPVGALLMKDEAGPDEKIVAVPVDKLHPFYSGVKTYKDLPVILTEQIAHFFQHYKDLEKGKWVTIVNWVGPQQAERMITDGIGRAADKGDAVASRLVAGRSLKRDRSKRGKKA
jgi:hypothetical protein